MSHELGRPVYIKRDDQIGPGLGGNKTRKLEYLLADARQRGARKVVTFGGLQSNHARLTAAAARQLGLEPHLLYFARRPARLTGNLLLNELLGARMHFMVLADSIQTSKDGLRIDFKLKEGVQFHHGYGELTADDVKFSFERFIDPAVAASYKDDWGTLDHVEVTGKYAGTIILKEPFAPLWVSTLPATSGLILSRKAVTEKGKDYATSPVGSGSYEFSEWVPKQHVILKRFKDYTGPQPEWDEIREVLIPEDSQAEIALETGELDFGQIATDAIQRFQDNKKFKVAKITTFDYNGLLMNVQHPKLKDINVRQAIRYAIDVPAIVQGAYDGKAERACAALAPGQLGFWKDAPCYDRDLAKAKDYWAKAGLQTLDLTLSVYNSARERAVGEIIQANLAEIGIEVDIVAQDDATYWDAGMGDKGLNERQLSYIEWTTTNPDPAWTTMWFTCDQVKQYNWMEWCDTQYDTLHNAAKKELDATKRQDLYIQLQKVWEQNANAVWTVHPTLYFAGTANLVPALYPTGLPIPQAFQSA